LKSRGRCMTLGMQQQHRREECQIVWQDQIMALI
jgi:hypothetical protein